MGWKSLKEHFEIDGIVHVVSDRIFIGTPKNPRILSIGSDGVVTQHVIQLDDQFSQLLHKLGSDQSVLQELLGRTDSFSASTPVFTFINDELVTKHCEHLGWPNVTHDGQLMYLNTFSSDREKANLMARVNAEFLSRALKRLSKQSVEMESHV